VLAAPRIAALVRLRLFALTATAMAVRHVPPAPQIAAPAAVEAEAAVLARTAIVTLRKAARVAPRIAVIASNKDEHRGVAAGLIFLFPIFSSAANLVFWFILG